MEDGYNTIVEVQVRHIATLGLNDRLVVAAGGLAGLYYERKVATP